MRARPARPEGGGRHPIGGDCTFAEDPSVAAPDARLLWSAALDPGTLSLAALPGDRSDPDHVDLAMLEPWLTLVTDLGGEHGVLSDGRHHLRFDVADGSLAAGGPVVFHYRLHGIAGAEPGLLSLRRLIDLCKHRRFASHLFAPDPRIDRWLLALRVHDGLAAGASHRDIAIALYGAERVGSGWQGDAESLRLRIRRLARDARALASGGWRGLLRRAR